MKDTQTTQITKHILILGPAGSGKTYTATALQRRGIPAFDGDAVPNLIHFVDKNGNTVPYSDNPGAEWFAQHDFVWREHVLKQLLADHPTVYLFGHADNAFDLMSWFDKTYYLKTSQTLRLQRLLSPERIIPWE
ncbi:MAG: AAA family ATPase [Chloroflexota bacterium]